MRMFRRVLAIVTRSFYHTNCRQLKQSIARPLSAVHKSINYQQYRVQTTSNGKTSNTSRLISIESAQRKQRRKNSKSSFRKQLIYVAAATSLSYIGYKYYFYDRNESMIEMIENVLLRMRNKDLIFKMGVWMDTHKRYKRALYFYKLYLRDAATKSGHGEYAALNNMILIYYRLNQYDDALTAFELLGYPQIIGRNLEFIKAHSHHSLLQYDLAVIWYNKYLNNASSDADIEATYNNLALLYYDLAQYEKAYKYFAKLGDETIVEKQYLFRVAHCLQQVDEFEKSLHYYNAYLSYASCDSIDANVENAYHNLAVLFSDNGKDTEAIEMFTKLGDTQLAERHLEFKMAHCCWRVGDHENGIKYLRECMNKKAEYGEYALICHGIIAQILYETEFYREAKDEFDALGERQIIAQDLHFAAASTYFKCGDYELALKYYQLLIENSKISTSLDEAAFVFCRIAFCFYKMKKYAECEQIICEQLSAHNIEEWNMEFVVAHSHHKLCQYPQAKRYYLSFLSNERSTALDVINCYQNLALLCLDLAEFEECIEYFALLGDDEIINRRLEFYVAYACQQLGRNQECIKYYTFYLEREESLDVYSALGSAYYEMAQYRDAIAVWSKLSDSEILARDLAHKLSKCYNYSQDDESAQKYRMMMNISQRLQMAKMHYDLHEHQDAIRIFSDVDDDDICKYGAEFVAAHCYQLIGDNWSAIRYYKLGILNLKDAYDENDIDERMRVYHNLACAYHEHGNYADAIECFDRLSDKHINETNVEFLIAVCYQALSQNENALKYYQLFCENPSSAKDEEKMTQCFKNMIVLYSTRSDYQSAANVLQQMNEEEIISAQLEFESAQIALKLKDNQRAIQYFTLFVQNHEINEDVMNTIYQNCQQACDEAQSSSVDQEEEEYKKMKLFCEWIKKQC